MSAQFRRAGALTYGSRICPAGLKAIIVDVDGTLYTQTRLRRAMAIRVVRHAIAHPSQIESLQPAERKSSCALRNARST
jgi:hypothetical protein